MDIVGFVPADSTHYQVKFLNSINLKETLFLKVTLFTPALLCASAPGLLVK